MIRSHSNPCLIAVITCCFLFSSCGSQPKEIQQTDFSTADKIRLQSLKYFEFEGDRMLATSRQKIIITQFAIELVVSESQLDPSGKFRLLNVLDIAGFGKTKIQFDDLLKLNLPNRMYKAFDIELKRAGFDVVSKRDLLMNRLYQEYRGPQNTIPKDTKKPSLGAAQNTEFYSASGLKRILNHNIDFTEGKDAEKNLLKILGCDVAIHALFRVGIDSSGNATLESGAKLHVLFHSIRDHQTGSLGKTKQISLTSIQPLRTDSPVIDSDHFTPIKGKVFVINPKKYSEGIRKIFSPYSRMAIELMK